MNDTTLPITSDESANPRRPHRGKSGHGKVRRGYGLHDWMRLLRGDPDPARRGGAPVRRGIALAEVAAHDRPDDGWMVLRGRVYNVSPYLQYHPGGSQILEECLGGDATALFERYHAWVNIDTLVGPLLLGSVGPAEMGEIAEIEEGSSDDDSEEVENVALAEATASGAAPRARSATASSKKSVF